MSQVTIVYHGITMVIFEQGSRCNGPQLPTRHDDDDDDDVDGKRSDNILVAIPTFSSILDLPLGLTEFMPYMHKLSFCSPSDSFSAEG